MNTSFDFPLDFSSDEHFDPNFKSRTFPANWDLSELAVSKTDGAGERMPVSLGNAQISPDQSASLELPEVFDLWFLESFPKLMTTPTEWDLSELV